jgi:hypothetical protein
LPWLSVNSIIAGNAPGIRKLALLKLKKEFSYPACVISAFNPSLFIIDNHKI